MRAWHTKVAAAAIGLWVLGCAMVCGQNTPDFADFPYEFSIPDYKFRGDQEAWIRTLLKQNAANRNLSFNEDQPIQPALAAALEQSPNLLISLLSSPDEYLVEFALGGLAIRFGPNGASAIPSLLKLIDSPTADARTRQLSIRALGKVNLDRARLFSDLYPRLQKLELESVGVHFALAQILGECAQISAATNAKPWLSARLGSSSTRVQLQALETLAKIERPPQVTLQTLLQPGALETIKPTQWIQVLAEFASRDHAIGSQLLSAVRSASPVGSPRYQIAIALSGARSLKNLDSANTRWVAEQLGDPDEFLQGLVLENLALPGRDSASAVPALAELLSDPQTKTRIKAAEALRGYAAKAAAATPQLADALRRCTEATHESELSVYLEALKAIGPGARLSQEALLELLPEQSKVLRNRSKLRIHHIRGFVLATLAEVGMPKKALPYILDSLANSPKNMAYVYAAGARAAGALGPDAKAAVPFLLRALKDEIIDDFISFDSLNVHRSKDGFYTTTKLETVKALARIGSGAREAIPLLQEISNTLPPNLSSAGRLHRVPSLPEEAKKALDAIRS